MSLVSNKIGKGLSMMEEVLEKFKSRKPMKIIAKYKTAATRYAAAVKERKSVSKNKETLRNLRRLVTHAIAKLADDEMALDKQILTDKEQLDAMEQTENKIDLLEAALAKLKKDKMNLRCAAPAQNNVGEPVEVVKAGEDTEIDELSENFSKLCG